MFGANTNTKRFSTPPQKPIPFRSPLKKQASSDPYTDTKPTSIQRLKPTHFWPPHQNQINSDPYTEIKSSSILFNQIKSISTTHTKTKSSSMLKLTPVVFCQHTKIKPNSTTSTKTKSIHPHTKTSHFRPARKIQVNFNPHAINHVNFDP